jgi:hypothetical protein
VVAPSGAGKSRLLEETFRGHGAFPNWGEKGKWCPLVSIAAPAPSTLGQVGIRILELLDYDLQREIKENNAWLRVRQQLRLNNVLFHAKVALADSDLAYVGSANMTMFSRHSMELGVLVEGRAARVVANVVRAVTKVSHPIPLP